MTEAAEKAGRPAPRFIAMVPVLLTDDEDAGRGTINQTLEMYGRIPSYRATLDRGGASLPTDVSVIGDAASNEAGIQAFAKIGVTEFAAAVARLAPTAHATMEILGDLATAGREST